MKKSSSLNLKVCIAATLALSSATAFAGYQHQPKNAAQILKTLQSIDSSIPASTFAISKAISNLNKGEDPFFPEIPIPLPFSSANQQQSLNTQKSVNALSGQLTQKFIDKSLKSLPEKLTKGYKQISPVIQGLATFQNATRDLMIKNSDVKQSQAYHLTYDLSSFDSLWPPLCAGYTDIQSCKASSYYKKLAANAQDFNFNAFLDPTNYPKTDDNNQPTKYIQYALQTYDPLLSTQSTPSIPGQSGKQDQSFFQQLNDYLGSNPSVNGVLSVINILKEPKFQKFWLNLRSYEAQKSLAISNFNYLAAERTPQKGLGTAYSMNTTNASALQVENHFMNITINNPTWYQGMKTASPATLQREQLMLTAQLIRIQYKNQMLNERLLATQTMSMDNMLQTTKQMLNGKLEQLKSLIPNGSGDNNSSSSSSASSYKKYDTKDNRSKAESYKKDHGNSVSNKDIDKYTDNQ